MQLNQHCLPKPYFCIQKKPNDFNLKELFLNLLKMTNNRFAESCKDFKQMKRIIKPILLLDAQRINVYFIQRNCTALQEYYKLFIMKRQNYRR